MRIAQLLKIVFLVFGLLYIALFLISFSKRAQREVYELELVTQSEKGKLFQLASGAELHYEYHPATKKALATVMFLHGFGGNLHNWEQQFPILRRDYNVLAVDLMGFGLSQNTQGKIFGPDEQVSALLSLVQNLGLNSIVLVGHSYGGGVAQRLALSDSQRIVGLVLVGSVDLSGKSGAESLQWVNSPWLLQIPLELSISETLISDILKSAFADPKKLTPQIIQQYYKPLQIRGSASVLINHLFSRATDRISETGNIKQPTILIFGEKDSWIGEQMKDNLLRGMLSAERAILENTGHVPHQENPIVFNQLLLSWLRRQKF